MTGNPLSRDQWLDHISRAMTLAEKGDLDSAVRLLDTVRLGAGDPIGGFAALKTAELNLGVLNHQDDDQLVIETAHLLKGAIDCSDERVRDAATDNLILLVKHFPHLVSLEEY